MSEDTFESTYSASDEVSKLKSERDQLKAQLEANHLFHALKDEQAKYDNAVTLLAQERDAWGKRETKLMAENKELDRVNLDYFRVLQEMPTYRDRNKDLVETIKGLEAEVEESHRAFNSLQDSFMQTSKFLEEACMKNKSLWEQFNLWKAENAKLKSVLAAWEKGQEPQ